MKNEKFVLENLLERVCHKTEFEVEGWRKIPPLMEIMENHYSSDLANIELRMSQTKFDSEKPSNSWIYEHFTNGPGTKIALYVNRLVPINENLDKEQLKSVGWHCVVVEGITKWTHQTNENNEKYEVNCFKIETFGADDQTRYIPVDHPFWEEVQSAAETIFTKGFDLFSRKLNSFGKRLAKVKYGTVEENWFEIKNPKTPKNNKYNMIFIRKHHPCYQLKFTSQLSQGTGFKIYFKGSILSGFRLSVLWFLG